jgi:hypothetical protein
MSRMAYPEKEFRRCPGHMSLDDDSHQNNARQGSERCKRRMLFQLFGYDSGVHEDTS